jgi:hypothetical protein
MKEADYEKCAQRIVHALALESGEKVVLKVDPRVFAPIITPLQKRIRDAGAFISGVVLAEETTSSLPEELETLRRLFSEADVFIWLPERHQGNTPAAAQALVEWLEARPLRSFPLEQRFVPDWVLAVAFAGCD